MKTIIKKIIRLPFISLLLIFFITACAKSDPELPLSDQLMGNYTAKSYFVNNRTVILPATNSDGVTATAQIIANKETDTFSTFTFVFTQTTLGVPKSSTSIMRNVELAKMSSGKIESADGLKRVEFQNDQITVIFPGNASVAPVTVYATKDGQ